MSIGSLTKCEIEMMDVVWRLGRASVRDVCEALDRPLAYTTVMTILKTLHSKRKVLKRSKRGRAFIYEPAVSRDEVCASVSRELGRHLVRGALKSFVLTLIQEESISRSDIAELRQAIEELETAP